MRDALSLLDTCMAYASDITLEVVSETAGIAGRETLFELIKAISEKDAPTAVAAIDRMYAASKDMTRLSVELTEQFRNIMMLQALPESKEDIVALPEEFAVLTELAEKLETDRVIGIVGELQKLADSLPKALEKRTAFELALIKLCSDRPEKSPDNPGNNSVNQSVINTLLDRVLHLEQRIAEIGQQNNIAQQNYQPPRQTPRQQTPPPTQSKPLSMSDFKPLPAWEDVLVRFGQSEPHIAATLTGSRAMFFENQLLIFAENKFFLELIKRRENAERLQAVLLEFTGTKFFIRAKCTEPETQNDTAQKIVESAVKSGIPTELI
jgi:DNA polymerase-3 subunit gamma/tau